MTDRTEESSPETAERVYQWMFEQARGRGRVAASQADIEVGVGIGQSTACRATRRLVRDGKVSVVRRGTSAMYPTVWRIEAQS